uniref:RZ-type domain-containing protein n=1 Tax=Physcomitrium patens TaxID=3218 RepID=A0A7I4D517_PHYPA|nr:uncharacterized protein LOC112295119 isoform X3 [Physcomitrium patens]|eukprot:XP_024402110.1 uncharacterized protein LOC112295119 isoform X3 [Physcomitrella patens]
MELEASSVVQFMSHSARDDNENVMTEKCREPAFTHYDSKSHFSSAEGLDDQDDRYRVSGSVVSDEFLISCSGGHSTNGDSSRCSSSILISDPSSVPNNDVGTSSSNEHGRNTRIGPSNAQDEGPSLPSPHLISQDTRSSHEKSISEVHFHENPGDRLISHSSHFPGEESYMDSSSHRQPRIWDSSTVSVEVIVIAPKWIEVEIDVHGMQEFERGKAGFSLGKGKDSKLRAWICRAQMSLFPGEKIMATYKTWSEGKDRLGSVVADLFNSMNLQLEPEVAETKNEVQLSNLGLHIDVCDNAGRKKNSQDYTLAEWLAVLRALTECVSEDNLQIVFTEYFYKRPNVSAMMALHKRHPSESLKIVVNWASDIQEVFFKDFGSKSRGEPSEKLVAKQGLVGVALLELLVEVGSKNLDLAKACLKALKSLNVFFRVIRIDSPVLRQELLRNVLQETIAQLVSCVSPFSFKWVRYVDMLAFFDPTLNFVNGWETFRFGEQMDREVNEARERYKEVIWKFYGSNICKSSEERLAVVASALQAAPTIQDFFHAAVIFRSKEVGWLFSENSNDSVAVHLMEEALHKCFAKIIEQHENPVSRKLRIQRQFELALNVDHRMVMERYLFLAPSFRDHLVELFQHILYLEDQSQGTSMSMKGSLSFLKPWGKDEKELNEAILNLVMSPHAFITPLRSCEVRLITALSTAISPKVYSQGRTVMIFLINREISYIEYHEVLKVWLQGAARRIISSGGFDVSVYLPPHSFLEALEELLVAGVESSLVSSLTRMAISMAVDECPNLHAFLQDSKKVTLFQSNVVEDHYLGAAGCMMEDVFVAFKTRSQLDEEASASFRAICQETNRNTFQFQNFIGERLCVMLLDTVMKVKGDLQHELHLRPIETIAEYKFATLLMQIEKCPQCITSHVLYKDIHKAFVSLGGSLHSESVSLRYIKLGSTTKDWEKIFHILDNTSFVVALEKAYKDLQIYEKRLDGYKVLLYNICLFLGDNNIAVEGHEEWRNWLARRCSEWKNFTMGEIHSAPDHWPSEHEAFFSYVDSIITLNTSRILLNVLLESVQIRGSDNDELIKKIPATDSKLEMSLEIPLSTIASIIIPEAVHQYEDDMRLFAAIDVNLDKIQMGRVCTLWNGILPNAVETEFKLSCKQLGLNSMKMRNVSKYFYNIETNIAIYLQTWKRVTVLRELHSILPRVASVFEMSENCDGLVLRIRKVITECIPQCSLHHFQEVLENGGQNVLSIFSTSEVDTLKELTNTGGLIAFLRQTVQEDLRHLLDAVEDPTAMRSWEGLINDLIDLQRVFRPILSRPSSTTSFEDLRAAILGELNSSSSSSNHLCRKLKACNEEAKTLRQYFDGVANRTHKDKDQIADILTFGKYHFLLNEDGCFLELKCGNEGESSKSTVTTNVAYSSLGAVSFNLTQLQELRSRARWTVSSNTFTKKSKTAESYGADWAGADAESIDTTDKNALTFISHIDVAENLVEILTELHNCGHFSYATFQKVVSDFASLQILNDQLKCELSTWKAALLRARKDFQCLNFFRSVEIRFILEVLMLQKTAPFGEKLEHCLDLFKWTRVSLVHLTGFKEEAASRGVLENVFRIAKLRHIAEESLIYSCLRDFSSVIESIIFQRNPDAKAARSKSRNSDGIILADVDDPQDELNVVVTLFSERDLYLHGSASNVIVCEFSTAWEDLYLLLLRYLNNEESEYNFYCVVYLERLSYDCQAQLLAMLEQIAQRRPVGDSELALVSCSRSKFLLTLSQRLQIQVRHPAAGTADAIKKEKKWMWVITSDLPGMGKTRFVREFAETDHPNDSIRTLTICGELSRNQLIRQLKKLFNIVNPTQTSSFILHLDVSVVSNPETLNGLLFELLVLGCLKSDRAGLFHLETRKVAIEVANTYHNYLASKLSVCKWFRTEHLVWNMAQFQPSKDLNSDDQYVWNYLAAMEAGILDRWNPDGKSNRSHLSLIDSGLGHGLLQRHFVDFLKDEQSISFSLLQTFTKFFAQQLREFSGCPFFYPENLVLMGAQSDTRSVIVRSILEVSRELLARSVKPWLDEQQGVTMSASAEVLMAARMENMQRWSDSKHVMIFFKLSSQPAILYRELSHVPTALVDLFQKQRAKLTNYESLSSDQLYENLWSILHKTQPPVRDKHYVLTADNFLKMALIFTKVKAGIPVVIMGETGCGKTSLLRQLADYCCVIFFSITLHAGTSEDEIRSFLSKAEKKSQNHLVWVLLDEINACNHLGFLVGVICHHLVDGKPLHCNLKIVAACNPYRKHEFKRQRAGLSTREMLKSRNLEYLEKAYTVHPLPEALVENVQDFGILNVKDEQAYIEAIVLRFTKLKFVPFPFTKLLVMSQAFVRGKCGEASVSLRDARRCVDLFNYFSEDLEGRPQSLPTECRAKRAALLSFAHCYYYRLASDEERAEYKVKYITTINGNNWRKRFARRSYTEKFDKELFEEQMNLLDHMEIPPGVAKNQALRENIFVTLTCILLKIPLFVVGKPGSGKTLSLQLIFSNLRGSGMKDPYFSEKPTMFMFSYQGSESSTSEGILKVFEKAHRCVQDNKKKNVKAIVVVVLDEVGLAEISSSNPLKVLHSLLEPEGEQRVAVIGISNWSLDAAKMNRAIHISQPDPSVNDLVGTAEAILDSYGMRSLFGVAQMTEMKWLAKVYHEYHVRQSKPDFHGLRDFYSLIKSLRGDEKNPKKWSPDCLKQAVWRNFGGSLNDIPLLTSILCEYFKHRQFVPPPTLDLVKANIEDQHARHLMLIGNGESCIGIIETMLPLKEKLIIIQGSKFKNDYNDDYAYMMLSNIILHMEHGRHIVLKGVERIWSSLYDMLNQHYITVGGRQNCRIAIGAFSNPMCYVHENFRCIAVVDQDQVESLDPPFLNRFEKQVLTWESVLSPEQRENVLFLKKWVKAMACTSEGDSEIEGISFCESDLFAGYSTDTLASLILLNWDTYSISGGTCFLERCKEELLQTAYIDGMMRAHYSRTCLRDAPDAKTWTKHYFQGMINQESLEYAVRQHVGDETLWYNSLGFKLVVTTRCNVHTNIRLVLKDLHCLKQLQIIKLADFTAERQLVAAIQSWSKSDSELLIVQSDTILDKDHLPLAKVHVERTRADLFAQAQSHTRPKHVVFILHSHRGEQEIASSFTFLSGWKQLTLDLLHQANTEYWQYLDKSIADLVRSERFREGNNLMVKVLTWSFLCIKYPRGKQSANYCLEMVQRICNDKHLCECFVQRALIWLDAVAKKEQEIGKFWQTSVVCNPGRLALALNLHSALITYVEEKLREPIARLIYVLESHSALGSYFNMTDARKDLWRSVFMDQQMVSIENVPEPMHPEGYTIKDPVSLYVPFSSLYAEHIDKQMREVFLARISGKQDKEVVSLALSMTKDVTVSLLDNPKMREIEECIQASPDDYCHDFCMLYAPYQSKIRTAPQALVFEWLLRGKAPDPKPLVLHALLWTKLEKLKTQALVAGSCFTENEISDEVELLKRDKVFKEYFDNKFASKCILKMLPSEKEVIDRAGGLQRWLYQLEALISLVPSIYIEEPTHVSIMLMLRVVRDFAKLIILPLSVASEHLCSLSHWFLRHNLQPCSKLLVTKIISLLPDLNTQQGLRRKMYFRFVASTFSLLLDSNSVSQDVISTISAVIFHLKAPTCSMKGVMLRFLKTVVQLLIPTPTLDCPHFLQLCFVNCSNVIKEQAWESDVYEPFILLSDVIYESVRGFITPELLSGVDTEAFKFNKFLQCLRVVTSVVKLPSGRLNFRAACAFAVLRSIMEVLARDMVTVQKKEPRIFHPGLAPAASEVLGEFFAKCHVNVISMKQYLMKVLYHHCGLSLQMMSHLACECQTNEHLKLYSHILDREMLKEVDNPLGFNPFMSIFSNYGENDVLLWKTVYSEGENQEKMKLQIHNLHPTEQSAFASAIASKIFLVQASRELNDAELAVVNWLQQKATLQRWNEKWKDAIRFLIDTNPLSLGGNTTTAESLQSKALAAHIFLVVTSFPSNSPLQGYMTLNEKHMVKDFVLATPNNVFSSFIGAISTAGTYKHICGYIYEVGECTLPMQSAKCPQCGGTIGGSSHTPVRGNMKHAIDIGTMNTGYLPDHDARSHPYHTVRRLEMKSYRTLRIVVNYCLLLGLYMGRNASKLAAALSVAESSVLKEMEKMIEEDLAMLGKLLNCNHGVTCQFMHSVVASMALSVDISHESLSTPEKRNLWETKFDRIVKTLLVDNAHQAAAEYVGKHRGKHELAELLEERRVPPLPVATTYFARTITLPDLKNFEAMYLQDEARQIKYPIIQRFFAHMSRLSEMKQLLGLLPFTKAVNEQLWSKITRPEASSISIGQYLSGLGDNDQHIRKYFPEFARAWNVMRFKVEAFECTQFKQGIPVMNLDSSVGFCLVEPRDLGIYLAAILDYLRAIQNRFLDEVMALVLPNQAITDESSHRSLRVQMCKAEEVVFYDEHWLQSIVCQTAMANLQYSRGQNPIYDYHSIAEKLQHQLVDQKPRLEIVLGPEILLQIQNEIEHDGVGAGQCLVILDVCLGFLRRTGGDPVEKLESYCRRWLGDQAFHLIQMHTLKMVELQHVVSLYEGLEDLAGVDIQALVNLRYRTPLSPDLEEELNSSVELKRSWLHPTQSSDAEEPKISAELFFGILRRFMLRHLIGDQLNPDVPLSIYITDPRLMKWPEVDVDVVDDVFPPSLLVKHSHATFLYLSKMVNVRNAT